MAASRLSTVAAVAAAAAAASFPALSNRAYADGPFRFSPFSSSPSPPSQQQADPPNSDAKSAAPPAADEPKGGFDPESLERGAKALREINSSPHAKQVFISL